MPFPTGDSDALLAEAVAIPAVYLLVVAFGRWLKRSQRVPLGFSYQLLAIALALWLPLLVTGFDFPQRPMVMRVLGAAVGLLGALFGIALLHRYFWEGWLSRKQEAPAPKFLRQIIALVLFLIAALGVLQFVLQKDITAALAASGVIAVVLGFAMQETLANIISGVALQVGKPFKTGDWLIAEGERAEVIEINWRSTRLRTNDDICLDIPNKAIVGATIVNLTYPNRAHGVRILVRFEYQAPPNVVKDCLVRAATNATGVLKTPPPKAFLKDFGDSAIIYEIKFTMEEEGRFNDINDAVRTNVWYEAQRCGLRIPFPIRTLQIERGRAKPEEHIESARLSARRQPILQLLDEAQLDKLLRTARLQRFGRGEKVIVQGAQGDSMFLMLSGEADVCVEAGGQATRVATLRAGDAFGEMSLLTGEPRSATVVARQDCELWRIDKETLGEILQQNEALVQRLGELLARRKMENEGLLTTAAQPAVEAGARQAEYTHTFLRKLSEFFEL